MSLLMLVALLGAGIVAGGLTTVAGLGGGILLIAGLSQVWSPATVLAVTAPALLVGNASRALVMVKQIEWALVARFVVTGVPTAFMGSLLAASLPTKWLRIAIALLLIGFVVHEVFPRRNAVEPAIAEAGHPNLVMVAGAIAGTVSGLTGGAGFVATPLLNRLGLAPRQLVATSAACMGLVHLTKGIGYGAGRLLTPDLLPLACLLTVGILGGNALGARVLQRLPKAVFQRCLLAGLALAAVELLATAHG